MSRNIYDLFNERKYGVDYLVEGYEFDLENAEGYEDLEECAEALDQITTESANEMIELQAAWYLEDLVIESMMFDDFDEDKIKSVMEGSNKEKSGGIVEKIKKLWQRVKQWFVSAFKTITNHFKSGETLVAKYRSQIPTAMQQCKAKVKHRPFNDFKAANDRCSAMISQLQIVGRTKEQILGVVGVSDAKGIKAKVEGLYFAGKDKNEANVNNMKPELVMKWAGDKKVMLDALKKQQKDIDGKFKEILAKIKDDNNAKADDASNFQYGIGIANSIMSQQMICVKAISNACTAIIKKALSGNYDKNKAYNNEAPDTKDVQKIKRTGNTPLLAAPANESYEIEFLEEDYEYDEYNDNDDFNW